MLNFLTRLDYGHKWKYVHTDAMVVPLSLGYTITLKSKYIAT